MSLIYCNLNREKISSAERDKLSDNPLYGLFARYKGKGFMGEVVFNGMGDSDAPKEYWNIVRVKFSNWVPKRDDGSGAWIEDIVLSEDYYDLKDAINYFREVLMDQEQITLEEVVEHEFQRVEGWKLTLPKNQFEKEIEKKAEQERIAALDKPAAYEVDAW